MKSLDRKIQTEDDLLFIDGYNIINSWDRFEEFSDLEESRRCLIDLLKEYQSYLTHLVVVVFDSYMVKNDRQIIIEDDLVIVYTKERETADHFIEEMVEIYGKKKNIKVATSDRVEQDIILARGATRISAKELEILVDGAMSSFSRIIQDDKIKNSLHLRRLDPKNEKILESLIQQIKETTDR